MSEDKKKVIRLHRDLRRSEKKFYRENSNIPKEYLDYKWSKKKGSKKYFDPEFEADKNYDVGPKTIGSRINALNIAAHYTRNLKENVEEGKSLFFLGGKNSGKTVLATLILRETINKLVENVLFVPFSQLVVEANVYLPEDVNEYTERYITPTILCIDDLDNTRKPSERFIQYLDHILTTRRLCKSPTIITSKITLHTVSKVFGNSIYELFADPTYTKVSIFSHDKQKHDVDFLYTGHSYRLSLLIKELQKVKRERKVDMGDRIDANAIQEALSKTVIE